MDVFGYVALLLGLLIPFCIAAYLQFSVRKARRLVITLKQNEGAFIGLRVEKHWNRWVFEDVSLVPTNPGARVDQAAPGRLHVPTRNILYYQEIANVAE